MNLASILRSLNGRQPIPYVPPRRRFDSEIPDIPEDIGPSPDYDPQDLDPTQGIGRREDVNQEMQGPQKKIPISEDVTEPDVPATTPNPNGFGQRLKAALPQMVRSGIVAASSPTRGQVGTAGDIFGSLRAVQDDRQKQDILARNMQRQSAKDAQEAEFNQARIGEQKARTQLEQAKAEDALRNKGKNDWEQQIAAAERILGPGNVTPEDKRVIMRLQYAQNQLHGDDALWAQQYSKALATGDPSQVKGVLSQMKDYYSAKRTGIGAKSANTYEGADVQDLTRRRDALDDQIRIKQGEGDEEAVAALTEERKNVADTIYKRQQQKRSTNVRNPFVKTDQGLVYPEVNEEGKQTGNVLPWQIKIGEKLQPVKEPPRVFAPKNKPKAPLREKPLDNGNWGVLNLETGQWVDTGRKVVPIPRAAAPKKDSVSALATAFGIKPPAQGASQGGPPPPPSVQPPTGPPIINAADVRKRLAAKRNVPESAITDREVTEVVRIATENAKKNQNR